MDNMDILIYKYKKQWKDIKNNTRSINKGSDTKLHWNYLNINVEPDTVNHKDKSNIKYFRTFIGNLNTQNIAQDLKLFDNLVELITYFLLINPQLFSQTLVHSKGVAELSNYGSGNKAECLWFLINNVIETFTRSLSNPIISLDNDMYEKFFFKLIDTLTNNWLQIAVDIYGSSLEFEINKLFQDNLMESYLKLTMYINDEQEDEVNIDEFLDSLIKECMFLTIIINQNNNNRNIHVINQHFRVILYLFDGLTEYLHQINEEYNMLLFEYDESIEEHKYNCKKLWFILGYFVKLLERPFTNSNLTHLNVDSVPFTMDFVKSNLV